MKRIVLLLALFVASTALGQTAASKIADGRAALVAHNMPLAHTRFGEALALDPANQTAAALLGLTRLFDVTTQTSSQNFLDGLGMTPNPGATGNGRDVYDWNSSPGRDGNDEPALPANYNFTTFEAYWQSTLLPESQAARVNFAVVTNPDFLITLSAAETKMPVALNVDYADILMASACLRAAEFLAHWGSGQNLDVNLDGVLQAMKGNLFTLQKVLNDNPNFLTIGSTSERAAAQAALLDLIALYRQASIAIRARPAGLHRLFMLAPEDLPMEAQFRQALDKVELSLTAPVNINGKSLYAQPLFDTTWTARAQLPTFSATGFNVLSVPDASLGGVLAGFTKEKIAAALSNSHNTVAEMGWEWVSPKPMGNTLYKYMSLPGGKHLVTGNGGTHLTSNDGINWTYNRIPGQGQFVNVATDGSSQLVGISADGFIQVSTDAGVSWRRVYQVEDQLNDIAYGNGRYVVVTESGTVLTSSDGESWDEFVPNSLSSSRVLYATTSSLFVAAAFDNSTQNTVIQTSPDGVTWARPYDAPHSGSGITGLAQDGGGVLIGLLTNLTQQLVSTNGGTSWTVETAPGVAGGLAYSLGKFVAVGAPIFQQETATAAGTITSANGTNVAVTITGAGITGSPLTINVTVNNNNTAATWAASVRGALSTNLAITSLYSVSGSNTSIILTRINPAANDATLNIALANGTSTGVTLATTSANTRAGSIANILTSADSGTTWIPIVSGEAVSFSGVSAGSGATYVMGQGGVLMTSTDNVTFTRLLPTATVTPLQLNRPLLAIKAMDGQLYAGGGNNATGGAVITRSADGQNFTAATVPGTANNITDFVRFSATDYYASGNLGTILKSTDSGATWLQVTSGTTANLNAITYLNSQFIALGNGSTIRLSADGSTWTGSNNPVGGMQLNGVAYGNGVYVVVGGNNSNGLNGAPPSVSYVITSTTAASGTWTQQNPQTNQTLKGVVFYQGVFTAVGTNGVIRRSTDGITWWAAGSGDITSNIFSVSVLDGRYYATQGNGNLDSTVFDSQSAVLMSSNGEDWVRVPQGTVNAPSRIELFGGRLYTANQNAGILRTQSVAALALPAVQILTPPAAYTGTPQGQTLTLAVTVTSEGGVTYQWKKDNVVINGATGSGLVLTNIQAGDAGTYTVDVTNATGTTTSSNIVVTVSGTAVAPVITSQPESQTVNVGLSTSFSVEATGTALLTYQWKKDGVNLTDTGNVSGSLTDTLTLTALTATNGGTYSVVVTNGVNSATSLDAVLTVDSNPAYTFSTLAGLAFTSGNLDNTGSAARFNLPYGTAVDLAGNVYVSSLATHSIRMITPAGVVTTIAGSTSSLSGTTDATGTAARFNQPAGLAVNPAGTILYVADSGSGRIRKVDLTSFVVTTLTSGAPSVNALVVDASANVYYVSYDHTVRKVTSGGTVTVLAGAGGVSGSVNGTGSGARFNFPRGIAMDSTATNLYIADTNNALIRKIVISTGVVTTYAGQLNSFGSTDGPVLSATIDFPMGMAMDSIGNLFFAEGNQYNGTSANLIRKISPALIISTIGGEEHNGGAVDGVGTDARFAGPLGVAVHSSGNLYIPDYYSHIIRKGVPVTAVNAPIIGVSPEDQTVNVGSNVTMSVTATGVSALSYQWRKDGVNLSDGGNVSGATTATLSLANVQTSDTGSYRVLVTATEGTALSAPAVLTVSVAPLITVQPVAQAVGIGQAINLSVTATDSGDLTYQWRRNGQDIAGATGSTYTIPTAQRGDAAVYDVVINGVGGAVTSSPTVVSVAPSAYPGELAFDSSYSASPLLSISARIYAALPLPGGKWMVGGDFVRWGSTARPGLARLNADYSLDLTFTPPDINGYVLALALAPDGSVYVGGEFTAVNGHAVPGLFRLNSSHALDLAWRELDSPPYSPVCALAVQSNGKVLVARAATVSNEAATTGTNVLTRLNADGTLDGTFSVNIASNGARLNSIMVEPAGAIAFAGQFSQVNGTTHNGFARVDATGATVDAAFGGTGTNSNATVFSMTRLADQTYLLGGSFTTINGVTRNRAAIVNADGTLAAFAPAGINNSVFGAAQQSDGKILLAGAFTTVNAGVNATDGLVRLTSTGAFDLAYPSSATTASFSTTRQIFVFPQGDGSTALFGSFQIALNQRRVGLAVIAAGGTLTVSPASLLYRPAFASGAFAQADGQTAVFGSIDVAGATGPLGQAVRVNDDGTIDGTFPAGSGYHLNGLSTFGISRVVRQSDGKFLAVGDLDGFDGNPAARLLRINADGTFDHSFDAGGGPSSTSPLLLALSGGRTLLFGIASGYTYNGQGVGTAVRLNEDGSRDSAFNVGSGINTGTITAAYEQPDGKIVMSGAFTSYNGTAANGLIRVNTNGSLDPTFSAGSGITASTFINAIVGLPDGRLAIAGSFTTYNGAPANRMAVLSPTGTLDGSFTAPAELNAAVSQVLLQEDGKFILTGDFTATTTPYFVRLASNGTVDPTFVLRGVTGVFTSGPRVFIGDDGSLYLNTSGSSFNYGSPLALVRFRGAPVAPTVGTAPVAANGSYGGAATLFVQAAGTAPFTYQWRKGGVPISDAASHINGSNYSVLNFTNLVGGDAGNYDVVITSSSGNVTTTPVALTIGSQPQTITFNDPPDIPFTTTPVTLTASSDSNLPLTFTVLSGPATVSGNLLTITNSGTVTIRASQAGDSTYLAAANVDQSFDVTATGFSTWRQTYFSVGELANLTLSGPNAIYGHDGLSNLLKYALGLNPTVDATTGLPGASVVGSDWVYTYTRPASITGITYTVEISTNLTAWTTAEVTHEFVSTSGGTDTWHAKYPLASAANVFFRLKVTAP